MANVSGNLRQLSKQARQGEIKFRLRDMILIGDSLSPTDEIVTRSLPNGNFSVVLGAGDYEVTVNKRDKTRIAVPDNDLNYNIGQLISAQIAFPPGTIIVGNATLATDTAAGIVRTLTTGGPPVVPRVEDIPAVLAALTGSFRLKDGTQAQLKNISDNKWHSLYIANVDGFPMLQITETGET